MQKEFGYRYNLGPGQEQYVRGSVLGNCQFFGHKKYREVFGLHLPSWMRSEEAYGDETKFFRTVGPTDVYQAGDLFLFGRKGIEKARALHWALYMGLQDHGNILLEHANVIDGSVGLWPLSRFLEEPRYAQLVSVKRPLVLDAVPAGILMPSSTVVEFR